MPLFYIKLISFNGLSFLFMRTFVALPLFSPAIVARSHATYGLKCGARAANRLPPHVADQCEPAASLAAGVMARFPRRALPRRRRLASSRWCRCRPRIGGLLNGPCCGTSAPAISCRVRVGRATRKYPSPCPWTAGFRRGCGRALRVPAHTEGRRLIRFPYRRSCSLDKSE